VLAIIIKIMKKSLVSLLLLLFSAFGQPMPDPSFAEEEKTLSRDEQNKEALKAFEKVLSLTESAERANVLPQIEAAYYDIIRRFPEAYLSQESYWRIMLIYLADYNPPAFAKAETLREEFLKKYPDSKLMDLIDSTLADGYYKHAQWDRLLKFYAPSIKQSIETGKFVKVADIFMYSEAKFRLNDLVEAEKGYKIVITTFPDSKESAVAKNRLEEIRAKRTK
jgi:tetratricopeptide (TPR) repeat protein